MRRRNRSCRLGAATRKRRAVVAVLALALVTACASGPDVIHVQRAPDGPFLKWYRGGYLEGQRRYGGLELSAIPSDSDIARGVGIPPFLPIGEGVDQEKVARFRRGFRDAVARARSDARARIEPSCERHWDPICLEKLHKMKEALVVQKKREEWRELEEANRRAETRRRSIRRAMQEAQAKEAPVPLPFAPIVKGHDREQARSLRRRLRSTKATCSGFFGETRLETLNEALAQKPSEATTRAYSELFGNGTLDRDLRAARDHAQTFVPRTCLY